MKAILVGAVAAAIMAVGCTENTDTVLTPETLTPESRSESRSRGGDSEKKQTPATATYVAAEATKYAVTHTCPTRVADEEWVLWNELRYWATKRNKALRDVPEEDMKEAHEEYIREHDRRQNIVLTAVAEIEPCPTEW